MRIVDLIDKKSVKLNLTSNEKLKKSLKRIKR